MSTFTLDVSTLSGQNLNYVETPFQEKGYSVVLRWDQPGANQDIRVVGHALRAVAGETMETEFPAQNLLTVFSPYGAGLYGAGYYGGLSTGTAGTGSGLFLLDISKLGGDTTVSSIYSAFQERGRSLQLEWSQGGNGQDLKIIGHAVRVVPSESHAMEKS